MCWVNLSNLSFEPGHCLLELCPIPQDFQHSCGTKRSKSSYVRLGHEVEVLSLFLFQWTGELLIDDRRQTFTEDLTQLLDQCPALLDHVKDRSILVGSAHHFGYQLSQDHRNITLVEQADRTIGQLLGDIRIDDGQCCLCDIGSQLDRLAVGVFTDV